MPTNFLKKEMRYEKQVTHKFSKYMKRLLFLFAIELLFLPCFGQLRVKSITQVADVGNQPLLFPSGEYMLVRDAGDIGLLCIDLISGKKTNILNDNNITGDIFLSDGGSMIAYNTTEYRDHFRYNILKSVNLSTKEIKELDEPSRELYGFNFVGGKVKIGKRNKVRSVRLLNDIRKVENEYIVAVEDDDLVLYDGTVRKVLNPNGKDTYLFVRLSPDKKSIVYVALNDKCHTFIYDINSSKTTDLGHYIGAPIWMGNDWIIGQQEEDDGHQMTSSRLVAIRVDGTQFQVLPTPQQRMPMNPSASTNGKIAFENEGKIFLMEIW